MRAILLLLLLPALAFAAGGSPNLAELRKTAESGDAAAQFSLGEMYRNGAGVPQDFIEGLKWCRPAAEQGYAPAQYILGRAYRNGTGVRTDFTEELKWCRQAAEQGYAPAQFDLGRAYRDGNHGIPKDMTQAATWFLCCG